MYKMTTPTLTKNLVFRTKDIKYKWHSKLRLKFDFSSEMLISSFIK